MTDPAPRPDPAAATLTERFRSRLVAERDPAVALVPDAAGGDPILWEPQEEERRDDHQYR